jgi:MoxR-like ATPase
LLTTISVAQEAHSVIRNVARAVVARESVIQLSVASLLAGGHVLFNDLPGVGKTLLARSLANSVHATFKRIQFTPDLLPSDITGSSIYLPAEGRFKFVPGPIFGNVVLADEVNRASTRTQAALLEAMAEGQVTADGTTHPLPDPFWVIATQNEVDGYGTFPLPQAQLDRFMMVLSIGYPSVDEQVSILERNENGDPVVDPVISLDRVRALQAHVRNVRVSRPIREYIARIVSSGDHPHIAIGASPRGVRVHPGTL